MKILNISFWIAFSIGIGIFNGGCAALYHVQISDIDNRKDQVLTPFDVKVSEVGVDLGQAQSIAKATNSSAGDSANDVLKAIQYFQMGPRTGAPVYSEKYAERLLYEIHQKCPSGRFTGVTSIRESRKYPVISGEIIKITGYCLTTRGPASQQNQNNEDSYE